MPRPRLLRCREGARRHCSERRPPSVRSVTEPGVKRATGSGVAINDVMDPKPDRSAQMRDMFKTLSHSWARVGLSQQLSQKAARRARRQAAVLLPALAGILVVYNYRQDIFGSAF